MSIRRLAQRVSIPLLAFAAAGPALAGVVYTPAANFSQNGTARRSRLVLSNPDLASPRAVGVRFIEEGVAGAPLPTGEFPTLWTPPGRTAVLGLGAATLPAGKAGMLEVFPGHPGMVVGARLVYEKAGAYSSYIDLPAITSESLRPPGGALYLQGLEHNTAAATITDLGLFNLGTAAATCTVDVHSGTTGAALVTDAAFSVPPVSSAMVANAFGAAALNRQVPAGSWARVSCNRPFWAFAVRHNATYGGLRLALPVATFAQSTLPQPGGQPPSGGQFNFRRPGLFLTCSPANRFWRTSLSDSRVAGRQFRRIVVDFDVYHANWDPQKNTHIYMWLQNGQSWTSGLFGYLIAAKRTGVMRFQVKYGVNSQQNGGPSGQPGGTYHVRYEWNGITRRVSFVLTNPGGGVRASRTMNLNRGAFTVGGMFFATGSWPTGEGPEALQYGWRYSNLNVDYFQ
jgi:hypothetical protein